MTYMRGPREILSRRFPVTGRAPPAHVVNGTRFPKSGIRTSCDSRQHYADWRLRSTILTHNLCIEMLLLEPGGIHDFFVGHGDARRDDDELVVIVVLAVRDGDADECLQQFMLANDSVTLAVEVPIWLAEEDIAALEAKHGIELAPRTGDAERTITGHLDFLQVRNGAVHILDYNPTHAPTSRSHGSRSTRSRSEACAGPPHFDIKCAWFNGQEYCELFPRTLFAKKRG